MMTRTDKRFLKNSKKKTSELEKIETKTANKNLKIEEKLTKKIIKASIEKISEGNKTSIYRIDTINPGKRFGMLFTGWPQVNKRIAYKLYRELNEQLKNTKFRIIYSFATSPCLSPRLYVFTGTEEECDKAVKNIKTFYDDLYEVLDKDL